MEVIVAIFLLATLQIVSGRLSDVNEAFDVHGLLAMNSMVAVGTDADIRENFLLFEFILSTIAEYIIRFSVNSEPSITIQIVF